MEEQINSTPANPDTSNPQEPAMPDGASNAVDFQQTATQDALRQEAEALSVQETGEPIVGVSQASSDNLAYLGIIAVFALVAVGVFVLVRLLKESVEDMTDTPTEFTEKRSANTTTNSANAKTKTSPKKKTKKPNKTTSKRKKSAKKR